MNLDEHLLVSVLVAPFAVIATLGSPSALELLFGYSVAVAAGVLIDLDHFPIMRLESGNWDDLKKAIRDPKGVVTDYRNLTVFSLRKKYAGHIVSMTAVLTFFQILLPDYSVLVGLMFALHLLMDLIASFQMNTFPFGDADPGTERKTIT